MARDSHWQLFIDTGGTFTDCLAIDPAGREHRAKVLSSSALRGEIVEQVDDTRLRINRSWPAIDGFGVGFTLRLLGEGQREYLITDDVADTGIITLKRAMAESLPAGVRCEFRTDLPAPILAAHLVTRTPMAESLPSLSMRLATTRGTNALLERKGDPVALFITKGFGDLLHIGNQQRPDLFAVRVVKPPVLHEHFVEVHERLAADGDLLESIDEQRLQRDAEQLVRQGITSAAVVLMHSFRNPKHEQTVAAILRETGFSHVSVSSDIAPLIKIVPRGQTTVVNAYLAGSVESYVQSIQSHVRGCLHMMTSTGGIVSAKAFQPCESLLSGPAGGVAGAAATGRAHDCDHVISFDMGGTSTDVARYAGEFQYTSKHHVGSAELMTPALDIETVAAGGGSICTAREGRFVVGPESASAVPGPACYGLGGPLTITDVNLLLGRIVPERFEIPIARDASESAWRSIDHNQAGDDQSLLQGFLDIANERMADAIRAISTRRGYDPADATLVAFGGAGGQHACAVASLLHMTHVLIPADASLLSAVGLREAVIERIAQEQILSRIDDITSDALRAKFDELARTAKQSVQRDADDPNVKIQIRQRVLNLRLLGQESTIEVEYAEDQSIENRFAEQYEVIFGHRPGSKPTEIESIRVVVATVSRTEPAPTDALHSDSAAESHRTQRMFIDMSWTDVPCYEWDTLQVGQALNGPALVVARNTTAVIESGWCVTVTADRSLSLTRSAETSAKTSDAIRDEAVAVELFSNRFTAIAEDMGQMLERTALSTNVKERLDFSCTILDPDGHLVVNAPHMPVHLGAMGLCVRAVRHTIDMQPGDCIITNHPAYGGSHLPDITVITPVFADEQLCAFVASRAHHAEIGGARPGSMPPDARTLAEEGVVIAPMHLIRRGVTCFADVEAVLRGGQFPSRAVNDNLADLNAQVAANQRGATSLLRLIEHAGRRTVARYMNAITAHAERSVRLAFRELRKDHYYAVEQLDDGSTLQVDITIADDRAVFDFTGSASQHPGNLNATPAIVHSVVLYVLRLLIGRPVPLNEGMMRSVDVRIPTGLLNPIFDHDPAKSPAVVGGNIETSQRLVDLLLKAFGIAACSQGTMNNTLFGNDRFGYYETVCGGTGATKQGPGADAVHSHMTNTRITDPEILEHRYPVRLHRFAMRKGSGGAGWYCGGDGVVREIEFLQPMKLSMLTQHRMVEPFGMSDGEPGAVGHQRVLRHDGSTLELRPIDGCDMEAGDRLILETPGGGGFGKPNSPG